jgi:hypothetical protein
MSEERRPLALPRDTPSDFPAAVSVFFSHWSPRVLLGGMLLTCAARAAGGALGPADLLLPLAVLLGWPLLEWLIHVHILHFRPRTVLGLRIDPMNARRHRAHHLDPWRFERAFVPVPSLLLIQSALLCSAAISPWPALWTVAVVITGLALRYEWVHYLCHIRYCPSSHRYRTLVQNHRRHHFKNEKYWLGVSMLSGDRLLGTDGDPAEVAHSATVRTIHGPQLA